PTARQLDDVFWLEEERVLSEDWVVRYKNRLLQLARQNRHWAPAQSRVRVWENEPGHIVIHYCGQSLPFREIPLASSTARSRGRKMVRLQTRIFSHRACVSILLLFFLFFVLFGPALAGQDKAPTEAAAANSVVAIGDVHGDFDDFVTILQKAGLIDEQHHWTGGKTTFVQVGDLLDRGPKPRDVMDLMMSLEKEAPKAGGRIV